MKANTVVLVGNPNAGKTTLFNALTDSNQQVGNWSGVTVNAKQSRYQFAEHYTSLCDLPGCYSLVTASNDVPLDEQLTRQHVFTKQFDLIINVVDVSNLARNLYLSIQLRELGLPFMVVLTHHNLREQPFYLDKQKLSEILQCPVLSMPEQPTATDLTQLKQEIQAYLNLIQKKPVNRLQLAYPQLIQNFIKNWAPRFATQFPCIQDTGFARALFALEGDRITVSAECQQDFKLAKTALQNSLEEDIDITVATARYQYIDKLMEDIHFSAQINHQPTFSERLDQVILNRIFGIPIFLCVMYTMFLFAINFAGAFQSFVDISTKAVFVDAFAIVLQQCQLPQWLITILAQGMGQGINTTLTFIPVIAGMFFFLAFLEASGYMARAAFCMDRCMQWLGLPGKSFVPLIVGFGCNVPAVMGARTLECRRERILTILMSPFMSCGARLAIYAVFVSAFFQEGGHNVIFALYLIGIAIALITGLLLKKTLLVGESSKLVMELPRYRLPSFKFLLATTVRKTRHFVTKAGGIIIPLCMVLGSLNHIYINQQEDSILAVLGKKMTPVFSGMGVDEENWPATVGLLTGVIAKEVVVGTLAALYQIDEGPNADFDLGQELSTAVNSVTDKLAHFSDDISNPLIASSPAEEVNANMIGALNQHFKGPVAAFAYMLFVLLYFPCVSVIAVITRELNWRWAMFAVFWTTAIAYSAAVLFYQLMTFNDHPVSSGLWVAGIVNVFLLTLGGLRLVSQPETTQTLNRLPTRVTVIEH